MCHGLKGTRRGTNFSPMTYEIPNTTDVRGKLLDVERSCGMMMWYSLLMSMPCDEVRFRVWLSKVNDLTFCARVPCTYELIHVLRVDDNAKLFVSLMGKNSPRPIKIRTRLQATQIYR